MPTVDELVWLGLGVLGTLAVQLWLRVRARATALKSFMRRQVRLMHVAEAHGHAWDQGSGGVCANCRRDLTLPGVAENSCLPITEEVRAP